MSQSSKRRWYWLAAVASVPVLTASHLWAYEHSRRKALAWGRGGRAVEHLGRAAIVAKAWPCGVNTFQAQFADLYGTQLKGSAMGVEGWVLPRIRKEGPQERAHELELMIEEARRRAKSLKELVTLERLDDLSKCIDWWKSGHDLARLRGGARAPTIERQRK